MSHEDKTTVYNWLWTACSNNLLSYSALVDFRGPKSVVHVDYLTSSSSLYPPATTISCPQVQTSPAKKTHNGEIPESCYEGRQE